MTSYLLRITSHLLLTMSTTDSTSISTPAAIHASLPLAARFSVYTLLIAALSVMLPDIVRHCGVTFFYENGTLEWFQFSLLATNVLLFALSALCLPTYRQLAIILGCVTTFAATREVDRVLNRLLPVVGWKIGGLFLVVAAWLLLRHHRIVHCCRRSRHSCARQPSRCSGPVL